MLLSNFVTVSGEPAKTPRKKITQLTITNKTSTNMAKLDLSQYGIQNVKEVLHNPSYEVLFEEETKAGLEGFEKGQETELGAVNVMTGIYTGR